MMMNSHKINKANIFLLPETKQIITGMILSDAHLEYNTLKEKNARLK
jgi:hypothetical protein